MKTYYNTLFVSLLLILQSYSTYAQRSAIPEINYGLVKDTVQAATNSLTPSTENQCLKCHQKALSKQVPHKPVSDNCLACHQSNGKTHPLEDVEGYPLTKAVPDLCFSCHDKAKMIKSQVHSPVKEGDCLSCHDAHSSKNEHLVSVQPPNLCYSCHNDLQKSNETAKLVHGALTEKKGCLNCHSPHSTDEKKNLLLPQPDLCFTCHDKIITVGDRRLPNMKALINTSKNVHGAMDMGGCVACHDPHANSTRSLLKKNLATGNYAPASNLDNYSLCLDCHEKTLILDKESTLATRFRDGKRNLHYVHVNKEKGRVCLNCHNPHATNNLFLLADKVKFGQWDMPNKYTKLPNGGTCSPGCHSEKSYSRE